MSGKGNTKQELRSSVWAPLFKILYRALGCDRRWRLGRIVMNFIMRMEGGDFYSATARYLLAKWHDIHIGAYSYGSCFQVGGLPPGITIGRYCSIGKDARFFPRNHPMDHLSTHPFFYSPIFGFVKEDLITWNKLDIGHDVWIGEGVKITPGCRRVGNGAVLGAGSVVTKDVPDYAIVVGNPAQIIRYRFDEDMRKTLLETKWWEKSAPDVYKSYPVATQKSFQKSDLM